MRKGLLGTSLHSYMVGNACLHDLGPILVCGPHMGAAMDMAAVSMDCPFSLVTFPEILIFQ